MWFVFFFAARYTGDRARDNEDLVPFGSVEFTTRGVSLLSNGG